jgi:hypothetical protein
MRPLFLFRLGRLRATNGAILTLTSAAADPIEAAQRRRGDHTIFGRVRDLLRRSGHVG